MECPYSLPRLRTSLYETGNHTRKRVVSTIRTHDTLLYVQLFTLETGFKILETSTEDFAASAKAFTDVDDKELHKSKQKD